MPNLANLFRLQQIENEIESIAEELAGIESLYATKGAFDSASAEFEKANARRRDAERILKDAELALSSLETEKKNVEKKLYGGTVNNSKELTQLQRDLEQIDKRREKSDEQVLRGMENLESIVGEWKEKEMALGEAKARFDEEVGIAGTRKEKLEKQLSDLNVRRRQLSESLEPSLLELYQALKKKKRGLAIVPIQKNACGGCFMAVSESAVSRVKDLELTYCSSCGRLLYLEMSSSARK